MEMRPTLAVILLQNFLFLSLPQAPIDIWCYTANLLWKISVCVNIDWYQFSSNAGFTNQKTFSSCPFVRFCILWLWAPASCASNMHLLLRNILKFYCARDHPEILSCKQTVHYFVTQTVA